MVIWLYYLPQHDLQITFYICHHYFYKVCRNRCKWDYYPLGLFYFANHSIQYETDLRGCSAETRWADIFQMPQLCVVTSTESNTNAIISKIKKITKSQAILVEHLWIHPSIFVPIFSLAGSREAGAYPSCLWRKDRGPKTIWLLIAGLT